MNYDAIMVEQSNDWATGVLAGAVTPFDASGAVDAGALHGHVEWLAQRDVAAIVVAADTGEGQQLSAPERTAVLKTAVRAADAIGVPIFTGLVATHSCEAAEAAAEAEACGADGLQVFPPPAFLGPGLDPGMAAGYYEAIAGATELPLLVYRPPSALGYGFDDEVVARILSIDQVRGFKESSFDEATYVASLAIARRFPHVKFLSGADPFVVRSLELGADGLALALGAIAPRQYAELLSTFRRDGAAAAISEGHTLDAIPATIFAPPFRDFRARLKEALLQMGHLPSAAVRAPLQPVPESDRVAIRRMVEECELS